MDKHHFLLISCPSQGHINPILHLANRLLHLGARATFVTFATAFQKIPRSPTMPGLHSASISIGHDEGKNFINSMDEMKRVGSQSLSSLLLTLSNDGRPVTFLVYGFLLPWAATVARDHGIPSAFLSTQSATVLAIYHRFLKTHDGLLETEPGSFSNISLELPGLQPLKYEDLPSILLPNNPHVAVLPTLQEHIRNLEQDPKACVLLNTFDALEEEVIKVLGDYINVVVAIGPLMQLDSSISCDLFEKSKDYLPWLSSKPEGSVIYVSFGSLAVLQKKQVVEIYQGLIETRCPFLWVIRSMESEEEEMMKNLSEKEGLIVPWCSQVEVLCHGAVGCFLTHCGWNSTVESLVAGVPVVSVPQFSDQTTNSKMVETLGTGVRARGNEEGVVEREEIKKCLETVMGSGEKRVEMRRKAETWKRLAVESMNDHGKFNLKNFVESLEMGSSLM